MIKLKLSEKEVVLRHYSSPDYLISKDMHDTLFHYMGEEAGRATKRIARTIEKEIYRNLRRNGGHSICPYNRSL